MTSAALPTLRTPRLTLRPLREDDADAVYDGVSNFDVIRWLGRIPYPYERKDAVDFIARVTRGELRAWAIQDADGFVGVAGLDEELGYWLARPAWGKGYGFEAAHAVVEDWFSDPAAGDIESGHYSDNGRSERILHALGFEPVRQRARFARGLSQDVMGTDLVLTREAWEARRDFVVTTKRLTLRPWTPADAPVLAEIITHEVARMTGSMSAGWTIDAAEDYIEARQWRGFPGFMLAIDCKGQMIGAVGCGGTPVSLMYVLGAADWGQGFASEAAHAFTKEIFARFPVNRLQASCFEDNPASTRVLQKLGFQETGRGLGTSKARLEPAPLITYALTRDKLRASA